MGAFDDLIPGGAQPPGAFDDLVPKAKPQGAGAYLANQAKGAFYGGVRAAGATLQAPSERDRSEPGVMANIGKSMESYGNEGLKDVDQNAPSEGHNALTRGAGFAMRTIGGAIPLLAASTVGAETGGAVGGALGSVVPGVGNAIGAVGGAVVGGALGSAGQAKLESWHDTYHQALTELTDKGDPNADAKARAYADSSSNAAAAGMGVFGAVGGGVGRVGGKLVSALGKSATTPLEAAANVTGKTLLPEFAKGGAEMIAANQIVGAGGAAAQAQINREQGIGSQATPLQAIQDSAAETLAGGAAFLPFALHGAMRVVGQSKAIASAMGDPSVPDKSRTLAAQQVVSAIRKVDPDAADAYHTYATDAIAQKQPMTLDMLKPPEPVPEAAPPEPVPEAAPTVGGNTTQTPEEFAAEQEARGVAMRRQVEIDRTPSDLEVAQQPLPETAPVESAQNQMSSAESNVMPPVAEPPSAVPQRAPAGPLAAAAAMAPPVPVHPAVTPDTPPHVAAEIAELQRTVDTHTLPMSKRNAARAKIEALAVDTSVKPEQTDASVKPDTIGSSDMSIESSSRTLEKAQQMLAETPDSPLRQQLVEQAQAKLAEEHLASGEPLWKHPETNFDFAEHPLDAELLNLHNIQKSTGALDLDVDVAHMASPALVKSGRLSELPHEGGVTDAKFRARAKAESTARQVDRDAAKLDAEPPAPVAKPKPRVAETAEGVHKWLKDHPEVVSGSGHGLLTPHITVPGMPGIFRRAMDGSYERVSDDGTTIKPATKAEDADIEDAISKDQAQIVTRSRWGGSGNNTGSKTIAVLHSPSGNSFKARETDAEFDKRVAAQAKLDAEPSAGTPEAESKIGGYPASGMGDKALKAHLQSSNGADKVAAQTEIDRRAGVAPTSPLKMDGTTRPERKTPAPAPAFDSIHPNAQAKFNKAFDAKNPGDLSLLLHPKDHPAMRAEFEKRSGVTLPKTVGGTFEAVKGWMGKGEPESVPVTPVKPTVALPPEIEQKFNDIARLANTAKMKAPDGSPFTAEMVRDKYDNAVLNDAAGAGKLLDGTVKATTEKARAMVMSDLGPKFAEKFGPYPKNEAQLVAAIKAGSLEASADERHALGIKDNQIRQGEAGGVSDEAKHILTAFQAGVFDKPGRISHNLSGDAEAKEISEAANRQSEVSYREAAKAFLEGKLDAKVPTGNAARLDIDGLSDIRPRDIPRNVKKAKGFEAVRKALTAIAGDKDIRHYINGIHVEEADKRLVATDGHRAAVIDDAPLDGLPVMNDAQAKAGLTVLGHDGKWIDGKFPDWQRLIPDQYVGRPVEMDAAALGNYARGVDKAGRYTDRYKRFGASMYIEIDGTKTPLLASYVADMADLFRAMGYDKFVMSKRPDSTSSIFAESPDHRVRQFIMPIRDDGPFRPVVDGKVPTEPTPPPDKAPVPVVKPTVAEREPAPTLRNEPTEVDHNGTRLYQTKTQRDGVVSSHWAVETAENKAKREAGQRTIGGDSLLPTLEEAKKRADEERADDARRANRDAEREAERVATEAKKTADASINGFGDDLTAMQRGKIVATLNGRIRLDGKEMALKDAVRKLVDDGNKPNTEQVNAIKDMSRTQFNRAENGEQAAHAKRVAEGGKKTNYYVGDYVLGKTAHDYAAHLIARKVEPTPPPANPLRTHAEALIARSNVLDQTVPGLADKVRDALRTGAGDSREFARAAMKFTDPGLRDALIGMAGELKGKPKPAAAPAPTERPLTVGLKAKGGALNTEPVTVRDGQIHIGDEPIHDLETDEPVRVPDGATNAQIMDALTKAQALTDKQRFYGGDAPLRSTDITVTRAPANPHTPESLRTALAAQVPEMRKLLDNGAAHAITADQASTILGERAKPSDKAFFNPEDGTTYFIADHLAADGDLKGLVKHEVAVHAYQLGRTSPEFKDILRQLDNMKQTGNAAVKEAYAAVPKGVPDIHEEALALLVEANPEMGIVKRVAGWMRNALRAIGWKAPLSVNDLLYMAHTAMRSGRVAEREVGAPAVRSRSPFEGSEEAKTPMKATRETIRVDGVDRPAQNSNGKPIHWSEEGTRNFWRWFGDSKVVDKDGRPLVVYHGTTADFDTFDRTKGGSATLAGDAKGVTFFTTKAKVADDFSGYLHTTTDGKTVDQTFYKGANTLPVYLRLKDPSVWDMSGGAYEEGFLSDAIKDAKKEKSDGIVFTNMADGSVSTVGPWKVSHVIATFDPTQIKSATGNTGAFDRTNPSILKSSTIKADGYTIIKDPTREQAANLLARSKADNMRGLRDPSDGALYIWDAHDAIHHDVSKELNLSHGEYERLEFDKQQLAKLPDGVFSGEPGYGDTYAGREAASTAKLVNMSPAEFDRAFGPQMFSRSTDVALDRIRKATESLKTTDAMRGVAEGLDGLKRVAGPQYRSASAREIGRVINEAMGRNELFKQRTLNELNAAVKDNEQATTVAGKLRDWVQKGITDKADRLFVGAPKEENYKFMQTMDSADKSYFDANPDKRAVADVMRKMWSDLAAQVNALDTGALEHLRQDYFAHMWKSKIPEEVQKQIFAKIAKRPLEGGKTFDKQRVFEDIQAGLDAGYEPISDNPMDVVALSMHEMQKYIMAHTVLKSAEAAKDGSVVLLRAGEKVPAGMTDVNGRYSTITRRTPITEDALAKRLIGQGIDHDEAWREVKRTAAAGPLTVPESFRYVARDDVAQVVNNYLSQSLYHNKYVGKMFTAYMGAANTLNQFQLGAFSAFHAGFTSLEAIISHASIGVKAATAGDWKGAAKYLGEAPMAWYNNPKLGNKIMQAIMDSKMAPEGSEMAHILEGVQMAGFKIGMDQRFRTNSTKKMLDSWANGKPIAAAAHSISAVVEQSARPILEMLVPRQKLGVFGEMYKKWMNDNPNATHDELRNSAQQIWNRVDSRLGQVVYDRLFVHNVAKNLGQMLIRAPGWTGGTILEVGGGFKDLAEYAKALATGKKPPAISDRAAYTLSMLMVTSIANAALTAMFTGEAPDDWKDLLAFRTGNVDEAGRPERFMLPTYAKDVYAYTQAPLTTLSHKAHPILSLIGDVVANRDYYGTEIRSEDDGLLTQLMQTAGYTAKAFVPFWVKGAQKEVAREGSAASIAAPLVGVMPAPSAMNRTPAEKLMGEYGAERLPQGTRTQVDQAKKDARDQIFLALRKGEKDKAMELFQQAKSDGLMTPHEMQLVTVSARKDQAVNSFKKLTFDQATRVMAKADDDERSKFAPLMLKKQMEERRRLASMGQS